MRKSYSKTWVAPVPVALPITREEMMALGIDADKAIEAGELRGELKTCGPWGLPVSYRALAMSAVYREGFFTTTDSKTAYGLRTMGSCRQEGYCLEGRVSLNGKKYRAFTSSQLFELPDGKLIDLAVIHVCIK